MEQIIYKKISEIKEYKKNPRINEPAVEQVANSIKEFGFINPVVIDKKNIIVCGHTRYKAAQMLNINEVPCILVDNLTDEQIRAYRLADNKVSELAKWDEGLLRIELDDIFDIDMSDFGFEIEPEDEEDEDLTDAYENERVRTMDYYNLDYIDLDRCVGKYQIPLIKKTDHIPKDIMSFNYMLNTDDFDKGIHCYVDDYQFERLWSDPHRYLDRISLFDCCFTPDFSMYVEMPLSMMIWNKFRSNLIGQIMQDYGITVIPNIRFGREDSFDFCFEGYEPGGTFATSTISMKKDPKLLELWYKGMDVAMKKLKPNHMIVYGGDNGYKFDCDVTYFGNHNTERLANIDKKENEQGMN